MRKVFRCAALRSVDAIWGSEGSSTVEGEFITHPLHTVPEPDPGLPAEFVARSARVDDLIGVHELDQRAVEAGRATEHVGQNFDDAGEGAGQVKPHPFGGSGQPERIGHRSAENRNG